MDSEMSTLLVVVLLTLLGAAFCFGGYRLFLLLLPIWGFFAGFWFGGWAVTRFFGGGFLATVGGLVAGLVLGIGLATFSYLFFTVGVALVAGAVAAALASGVLAALGVGAGWLLVLVPVAAGIVVAVLTPLWNLQKYVIILVTAVAGADGLVVAALLLLGQVSLLSLQAGGNMIRPVLQNSPLWVLVGLALAAAGTLVQIRANRHYVFTRDRVVEGWK